MWIGCFLPNHAGLFQIQISPFDLIYCMQGVHTMRVRANLNAKGWTMILEGLELLKVVTAAADVPSLWELFKTFFRKVDDDTQSNLSAPSTSGHTATFQAAKWKADTVGEDFTKICPTPRDEEPGNFGKFFLYIF